MFHLLLHWTTLSGEPRKATEDTDPQPLQPGSTAGAMYFRETDYDDIIRLHYRKKSAVRTALENLIQEESHADCKDEHFATLSQNRCDLVWESTL